MGDMADDFQALKEHKREERAVKEKERYDYAMEKFRERGIVFTHGQNSCLILNIPLVNGSIEFYPFTGWFTGHRPLGHVKGRGIKELLKQIDNFYKVNE